ncbi:MAG: glycoside hydrolase family 19 protein [Agitococcus sp.]|nr:glycoside hydrolase family 19 protein [Agitococcus sp.]
MKITAQHLKTIMPKCNTDQWLNPLNQAMTQFEINTSSRIAAFLAQVAHESAETTVLSENLNYSALRLTQVWPHRFSTLAVAQNYAKNPEKLANFVYAGRGGNGNKASGDGWRYRGRGLFQLTTKDNYRFVGQALALPLVDKPDLLLSPEVAALTAAQFWQRLGLNVLADHQMGDNDEKDFEKISIKINGGKVGLVERKKYWQLAKKTLN